MLNLGQACEFPAPAGSRSGARRAKTAKINAGSIEILPTPRCFGVRGWRLSPGVPAKARSRPLTDGRTDGRAGGPGGGGSGEPGARKARKGVSPAIFGIKYHAGHLFWPRPPRPASTAGGCAPAWFGERVFLGPRRRPLKFNLRHRSLRYSSKSPSLFLPSFKFNPILKGVQEYSASLAKLQRVVFSAFSTPCSPLRRLSFESLKVNSHLNFGSWKLSEMPPGAREPI